MTDVLMSPIRLNELEVLIQNSVRKVLKESDIKGKPSASEEGPIDIHEAAKIIGKSIPTLYGYVHRNLIPHMKRGQRLYFYRKELLQWIESGRVRTTDEINQAAAESLEKS